MTITLSALVTTMLVSYILPALVALVTKLQASTWLKQFVNALLSALTGLITTAVTLDGTAVFSQNTLVLALGSFLLSQASYVALYKPYDANSKVAPGVGVG
jgi:hypothetical protein